MTGYIQLNRSDKTAELLQNPECFLLLTLIAYRARRSNEGINANGLEIGQALIGDFKSCGLSSEKVYRTAKKKLENWNLAAFKGTNKGTIATLLNSDIYNINADEVGEQKGEPRASKGRTEGDQRADDGRARGEQGATNNNGNNDKNVKNENNGNNVKKEDAGATLFPEDTTTDKTKKQKTKAPAAKSPAHLFRDSPFFDIVKLEAALVGTNYETANVPYYYECLLNWSDSKGEKKIDWLATAKNWMVRDIKENKFVDKNFKPQKTNGATTNGHGINGATAGTAARDIERQSMFNSINQKFS